MSKDLKIKRFDPLRQLRRYSNTLFIGEQEPEGRTTPECIRYYLWEYKLNGVVSIPGLEDVERKIAEYEETHPRTFQDDELEFEYVRQIILRELYRDTDFLPPGCLIVMKGPDVDSGKTLWNEDHMRFLPNVKNFGFTMMTLVKGNAHQLTAEKRVMYDHVFLQWEHDAEARKNLHRTCGGATDFETFEAIYRACTQNHGTLVVSSDVADDDPAERFFWFEPTDVAMLRTRDLERHRLNPQMVERVAREAPATGGRRLLLME